MSDLRKAAEDLLEGVEAAIKAGDWKVDGVCDPDSAIVRLRQALAQPVDAAIVAEVGIWGEDLDEREDLVTNPANPVKNFVKREEKNA